MFIKWVKELTREWWEQFGGLIEVVFTGYSLVCLVFCIADLLVSMDDIAKDWIWIHQYLIPFMWITGIVPVALRFSWRMGVKIFSLYLDYQYFAANGGKRKRSGEYDPYRKEQP